MAASDGRIRWLDLHLDRLEEGCRRLEIPAPSRNLLAGEIAAHCPRTRPRRRQAHRHARPRRARLSAAGPRHTDARARDFVVARLSRRPLSRRDQRATSASCGWRRILRSPASSTCAASSKCSRSWSCAATPCNKGCCSTRAAMSSAARAATYSSSADRVLTTPTSGALRNQRGDAQSRARNGPNARLARGRARPDAARSVFDADELFVTNALFGIWPVRDLDGRRFPVGPTTDASHAGARLSPWSLSESWLRLRRRARARVGGGRCRGTRLARAQHAAAVGRGRRLAAHRRAARRLRRVTADLAERGLLDQPWLLATYARLTGEATRVRAGEYQLGEGTTPLTLAREARGGDVYLHQITIVEGSRFAELLAALALASGRRSRRTWTALRS